MANTQSSIEAPREPEATHKTIVIYSNGDKFEGQRIHGVRHGEGEFVSKHGDRYKGQWLKDRKHGNGEMHYHSGEFYKGHWKNDQKSGSGEYTDLEGTIYNGQWLNDKMHGDGIMQYQNFCEYRGQWKHGVKHGDGEFIENGKKIKQVFENGILLKREIPKDYWDISDEDLAPYRDSQHRKGSSTSGANGKNETPDGELGPETLSLENFRVNLESLMEENSKTKLITDWGVSEVSGFLVRQGMQEYTSIFHDNEINGKNLLKQTETDLLEIGVKSKGHRVTLRDSIGKLCQLSKAEIRDKLQKKFGKNDRPQAERAHEPRKRRKFNEFNHRDQLEPEKKISESGEIVEPRSLKKSNGSSKKTKELSLKARSVSPNGKPRCHLAPPLSMEEKLVGYLEIIPKTIQEDDREVSESDDDWRSASPEQKPKNPKSSSDAKTGKKAESVSSKENSKIMGYKKNLPQPKLANEKKTSGKGLDVEVSDLGHYKFPRKNSAGELSPGARAGKKKNLFKELIASQNLKQKSSSDIDEIERMTKISRKLKNSKSSGKMVLDPLNSPVRPGKMSTFSIQANSPFDFELPDQGFLFSPQNPKKKGSAEIQSPGLPQLEGFCSNSDDEERFHQRNSHISRLYEQQLDLEALIESPHPDSEYMDSLEAQPSSKDTDDDPKDAEELKEKVNFVSRLDNESSSSDSENTSVSESIINKLIIPDTDIELGEYLGSGTLGRTYFGHSYCQEVVIKKCQRGGVASFRRKVLYKKAKHYSECSHPNLVLFMGITIGTNEYSIISEYMKNKSLWHNLHERKQKFSAQEKINLIEDVAKGMTYLHERDILHYSQKSQNILMDEGWGAKISDFGLRNYKHFGEERGAARGEDSSKFNRMDSKRDSVQTDNEYWIGPEIFNGEKYDNKCDVYSFGILMWEIISGQIPYKEYSKAQFQEVCRNPDNSLGDLQNKAHPKLLSLVKKCMHKHPGSRPAFKNLLNEIQQLKTGINNNKTIIKELNMFFGPIEQTNTRKN